MCDGIINKNCPIPRKCWLSMPVDKKKKKKSRVIIKWLVNRIVIYSICKIYDGCILVIIGTCIIGIY